MSVLILLLLLLIAPSSATIGATTGCLLRQTCNTTSTTALASTNSASVSTATTTTGGTTTPQCPLPLPVLPPNTTVVCSNGYWIVPGDVDGTIEIDRPATQLVINGNVTISGIALAGGSYVTSGGSASVDGDLNITLTEVPSAKTLVLVLQASNITGNFSRVNIAGPFGCYDVSGTQQRSADSSQLGVLIDVNSNACDHSQHTAVIVGACVGGVLGAALVLVLGALLAVRCGLISRTSYAFNDDSV